VTTQRSWNDQGETQDAAAHDEKKSAWKMGCDENAEKKCEGDRNARCAHQFSDKRHTTSDRIWDGTWVMFLSPVSGPLSPISVLLREQNTQKRASLSCVLSYDPRDKTTVAVVKAAEPYRPIGCNLKMMCCMTAS